MPSIEKNLALASQHQQAGRLAEAERVCRQVLEHSPGHARALHLLGLIEYQSGHGAAAVERLRAAAGASPGNAEVWFHLGVVLASQGKREEAMEAYRQAMAVRPGYLEAMSNLGAALSDAKREAEAIEVFREAVAANPARVEAYANLGHALQNADQADEAAQTWRQALERGAHVPELHFGLGRALLAQGNAEGARTALKRATELRPAYPEAWHHLGVALGEAGRLEEAIEACRHAVGVRPTYAEGYTALGGLLVLARRSKEAAAACRRALSLNEASAETHHNLSLALFQLGDYDGAARAARRAIALRAGFAEAYCDLVRALQYTGRFDEALEAGQQAVAANRDYAPAHDDLAAVLTDFGRNEEALVHYRRAVELAPEASAIHSNMLFVLHLQGDGDPSAVLAEHRRWAERHAPKAAGAVVVRDSRPDRRLRIGYVSPDFREHVVAKFLWPLVANHDRAQVEVFGYSAAPRPDAATERWKTLTDHWREIVGVEDEAVAALIRQDEIDILVDVAGHTAGNRLGVFARRAAPVQVTYLGYPGTTGLETIDYRLTDALADPPGLTEQWHSRRLYRLAETAWCFEGGHGTTAEAPPVGPPPCERSGRVTLGCFNRLAKVTSPMLATWAEVLAAAPESRLLVKNAGVGAAGGRAELERRLGEAGVSREQYELRGWERGYGEHLAAYGDVDIALDTYPYHGTTTTCEALWMGVPVVTLAGRTHVSRVGVSLLTNVGLQELIATTPEEYVRIAAELAGDAGRLRELRAGLRGRMEKSALMDGKRFARAVEAAYREMWRKWCAGREQEARGGQPGVTG